MFPELELNCVPNRSTCSRNSTVELLCGGVGGAELKKVEQSSPKQDLSFILAHSYVRVEFWELRVLGAFGNSRGVQCGG